MQHVNWRGMTTSLPFHFWHCFHLNAGEFTALRNSDKFTQEEQMLVQQPQGSKSARYISSNSSPAGQQTQQSLAASWSRTGAEP
jgi:hypothetical protein